MQMTYSILLGVHLILLSFISISLLTPKIFVLSPWEEKAMSFLLGIQLSFSFNLLYMNVYILEISCFIPLGGKNEVFPTRGPIEFLF